MLNNLCWSVSFFTLVTVSTSLASAQTSSSLDANALTGSWIITENRCLDSGKVMPIHDFAKYGIVTVDLDRKKYITSGQVGACAFRLLYDLEVRENVSELILTNPKLEYQHNCPADQSAFIALGPIVISFTLHRDSEGLVYWTSPFAAGMIRDCGRSRSEQKMAPYQGM